MMITHEKLLPCPFCGGEAEILPGAPGLYSAEKPLYHAKCKSCGSSTYGHGRDCAITAWNRRTPPANAEPVAYLIEGNVSRTRYLQFEPEVAECDQPLVTVSKLYLASPPAAVPDGWVMVPREPTPDMANAGDEYMPLFREWPEYAGLTGADVAVDVYRAMISAAPAAPTEASDE